MWKMPPQSKPAAATLRQRSLRRLPPDSPSGQSDAGDEFIKPDLDSHSPPLGAEGSGDSSTVLAARYVAWIRAIWRAQMIHVFIAAAQRILTGTDLSSWGGFSSSFFCSESYLLSNIMMHRK
jgi:hypothetical protein